MTGLVCKGPHSLSPLIGVISRAGGTSPVILILPVISPARALEAATAATIETTFIVFFISFSYLDLRFGRTLIFANCGSRDFVKFFTSYHF